MNLLTKKTTTILFIWIIPTIIFTTLNVFQSRTVTVIVVLEEDLSNHDSNVNNSSSYNYSSYTTNNTTASTTTTYLSTQHTHDNVTNIPVFYNLFVTPHSSNPNETKRVQNLVTEQLSYLNASLHHPVYINTIGYDLHIPNTTQLQHYSKGQETLTLYTLWDHCRQHNQRTNPNARVIYLHSKGSYHNHERNNKLRSFATTGATSHHCTDNLRIQQMKNNDDHDDDEEQQPQPQQQPRQSQPQQQPPLCDVCSIRFSPYPHPHTSGNMWSARCEYIATLPNPLQFEYLMERFVPRIHTARQPYHVGRKRFAAEHWVHSHPSVRPCDVYKGKFTSGYQGAKYRHELLLQSSSSQSQQSKGSEKSTSTSSSSSSSLLEFAVAPRFQLEYYRDNSKLDYWTGLDARIEEYTMLYGKNNSNISSNHNHNNQNRTTTMTTTSTITTSIDYTVVPDTWWGWKLDTWVNEYQQKQQRQQSQRPQP